MVSRIEHSVIIHQSITRVNSRHVMGTMDLQKGFVVEYLDRRLKSNHTSAIRMILLIVFLFVGFSCEEAPTRSKIGSLSVIEVMPATLNLEIDSTHQVYAIGRDANLNVIVGLTFTWTSQNPEVGTIDDSGLFTAISPGTTFLTAKSYTIESAEVTVSVVEKTTGSVTDIDGNIYQTIKVGDQWWLAENLKVTHFRNGEAIPHITDAGEWYSLTITAYCEYDTNAENVDTYGRLYNWFAIIDTRMIALEGWHVPSDEEWKQLEMALGMSQSEADNSGYRGVDQGSQLADNPELWNEGALVNNTALGSSGFAALPGGYRGFAGTFYNLGSNTYFWSATHSHRDSAAGRTLSHDSASVYRSNGGKRFGFSVRLVKD